MNAFNTNPFLQQYQPYPQAYPYAQQYVGQPQRQPTTPPMIHADIIQADSEDFVNSYPVGVGVTQAFMLRDESAIYFKTGEANGSSIIKYQKSASAPVQDTYIRRDEIEKLVREILAKNEVTDT